MKYDLLQWHLAAKEALATLHVMRTRLEVNDTEGEEEPFMEDCDNAIAMLEALPFNDEAIREHRNGRSMRLSPDDLIGEIQGVFITTEAMSPNRSLSMVKTKLDEARMWAEEIKRVEQ